MALTLNNPIGGATTSHPRFPIHFHHHRQFLPSILSLSYRTSTLVVSATGKFTSRTGKFDSKNRRGSSTTSTNEESEVKKNVLLKNYEDDADVADVIDGSSSVDDGYFLPELPGDKPDFWEGPQWDGLGFFVQYMWAFGILFALISSGIAVATYNEGATDFRETPAYKESIQSKDLLEVPEGSDTDVFESNPTEEAPTLE